MHYFNTGRDSAHVPARCVMRRAIAAAEAAAPAMKALGSWQRKEILMHCVERFTERKDELAMALCVEAGKPIKARGPARRAARGLALRASCATHAEHAAAL